MTPTHDEIKAIEEAVCDGCKNVFYIHEDECYLICELFQEELKEMREQND